MDALTALAIAARDGDEAALDRLVEGSYAQVWRLCARLVDPQCADDLAQNTFVHAVGALTRFRGDSSARTWLLAIARNACMDELRTRTRRRRRDSSLHTDVVARGRGPGDVGEEIALTDLLERLTPERREAFVLTQMLGLTYQETAEVCGCPPGTVRSRVARARAELLDALTHAAASGRYSSESSMYPIARDMTS